MRAFNTAGWSQSGGSNSLSTTPAAPSNVQAVRSGTSATVTWRNNARVAGGVQVQRREDGGEWLTVTTLPAGTTSWTHSSPNPAVTHQYRVRATVDEPILGSAWATSNIVQLAAPPNAPTGLSGPVIRDATDDVTWTWVHNPVDSSDQQQFELRHRPAGGSWTTVGPVASDVPSWTLPGGTYPNPVTVEWQVRTWGQHVDPSPWSATASSPTSARPSVLVNDPPDGSTVGTSSLTVTWGYDDAEASPQAAWQVELVDAADEVRESRSGAGAASQVTLHTVLPDESSWTVRVRAQDGAGLWSPWDESTFAVAYPSPPIPVVDTSWDPDTGTVAVQVTNPPPCTYEWTGTPHASPSVERDEDGFELRTNHVPNPSFEADTSWWLAARASLARDTTRVRRGAASAKITVTDDTAAQYVISSPSPSEWVPVTGGQSLTIAYDVLTEDTSRQFAAQVYEYDAEGALLNPVQTGPYQPSVAGEWVRHEHTFTLQPGTVSVRAVVGLTLNGYSIGTAWYIDGVFVGEAGDYFDGDTPSTVPTVSNDVYRSIDGGPEVLIATGVPADTTVTDYAPTVTGTNTYRVEAVSALPSVASSEPAEQVTPQPRDRKSVWLSGGPGFSQVCRASTNITIGESAGRAVKVLHRFAGRPHPVETTGEGLHRTLTLSVDMLTGQAADGATSPPPEWVALAELPGPHLWRDPSGRYVPVSISDVSTSRRPDGQVTSLTVVATEIDGA